MMNPIPIIVEKTPAGIWDEEIDWSNPSRQLGNDTIATSTWSAVGPDNTLTFTDESIGDPATSTIAWLNGGTLGNYYFVTNTIITAGGRTLTGTFIVSIVANVFLTQPNCI